MFKNFLLHTGKLTLAVVVGFAIFMGISVVWGQSGQPRLGPPGDNPPPPLNAGQMYQGKDGTLGAKSFFDATADAFVGTIKQYQMYINKRGVCESQIPIYGDFDSARTCKFSINTPLLNNIPSNVYEFCTDSDGCEVYVGFEGHFDGVKARGPGRLYITPYDDDKWRITKTIDPDTNTIDEKAGRDGGNVQRVFGFDKCHLTDEDTKGHDNRIGLSLEREPGAKCFLVIRD